MELLEREHLLAELQDCPPGHLALVTGEAGIGKSALIRTFGAATDRPVLWGGCDALRTPRPLGPLRDLARRAGGELAAVMAAESPRHEMFSAFLDYLTSNAAVAVVEDAHWADEATVDLLVFIGRRIATTQSLLIVSYRDDEIGPDHPLLLLFGALATDRTVVRLQLLPLSLDAVATLAEPAGVPAAELRARTGGNPFFVTEALADPAQPVPATVRDAVLARASRLEADARNALNAVAIVPGYAVLQLVHAEPDAIDACVAAGMLVRDGGHLRFRHELARLAVRDSIPPARRAALHQRALADLSGWHADPAALAYHAEEAGDAAAVLEHAPEAARRARALGAHRQAVEHYAQALRFSAGQPAADRAELLERYADACAAIDRDADAVAAAADALELWRAVGDREREAALLAARSGYLWTSGRNAEAHASARAAMERAAGLPPGPSLAAAYNWTARLRMLGRDIPGAIEAGNRAIELAERFGDRVLLARALNSVGTAHWFDDPELAEPILTRSVEVAKGAGDDVAVASALVNLGSGAGEVRRYATAERWLRQAIDWCSDRDLDSSRRYATAWLARCLFERGDWARVDSILEQSEPAGGAPSRIVTLTVLGRLRARRGDPGAAEALEDAWALAGQTGDLQRLGPVAAARAERAWLAGEPTDALVRDTYEQAVRLDHGWLIGELGQWLGETAVSDRAAEPYRMQPAAAAQRWDEIGCPYEAAMALTGSPERLREALQRLERLGARPAADRVARQLRNLGIRAPRRSTMVHPNGLTAREADVLELLREDLRNGEIAARLHISEKTVDHHVSAILAKLGVRTRRDAARYGETAGGT